MNRIERLKTTEQVFLRRCRNKNIFPQSMDRPVLVPSVVRHTKSATRLQLTCSRELLGQLIDEKYINIRKFEDQVKNARLALPLELQGVFTPVIEEVGCQTKSKQKNILEKKFDWLKRGHSSSRNKEDDRIDGGRRDTVPTDRVSVIGDIDVLYSAVEELAKGPGFAIAKTFTKDELHDRLQTEIATLAYAMRWKSAIESNSSTAVGSNPGGFIKCPFGAARRRAPPKCSRAVEELIKHFPQDVERLVNKGVPKIKRNLTREQLTTIKALRDD